MHFEDVSPPISEHLEGNGFVLRPIVAADTPLDYAAVMETRESLLRWEQTGWPAADFTLDDDLADVEGLERRHRDRGAFCFTVMAPDGSACLGCVYVMPPDARDYVDAVVTPLGGARWADVRALVYFWVRSSLMPDGLDAQLLDALRRWFAAEWDLAPLLFVTNAALPEQVALFEGAGLAPRLRYTKPGQAAPFLAFG